MSRVRTINPQTDIYGTKQIYKESISKEMNNDDLHGMTKLSGWLGAEMRPIIAGTTEYFHKIHNNGVALNKDNILIQRFDFI